MLFPYISKGQTLNWGTTVGGWKLKDAHKTIAWSSTIKSLFHLLFYLQYNSSRTNKTEGNMKKNQTWAKQKNEKDFNATWSHFTIFLLHPYIKHQNSQTKHSKPGESPLLAGKCSFSYVCFFPSLMFKHAVSTTSKACCDDHLTTCCSFLSRSFGSFVPLPLSQLWGVVKFYVQNETRVCSFPPSFSLSHTFVAIFPSFLLTLFSSTKRWRRLAGWKILPNNWQALEWRFAVRSGWLERLALLVWFA